MSFDILVVDDDPDEQHVVCELLRAAGLTSFRAGTGDSALAWLRNTQNKPKVLLLDLLMPGKDGWTVLWELRQSPELRDIPVVLMTAVTGQEHVLSEAGVVDYLIKPFEPQTLLQAVGRALGPRRRLLRLVSA